MPGRPENREELSPEAMATQAARREKRENKIKAERAHVLSSALHRYGNCGLIVLDGAPIEEFKEGFEAELGDRLLLFPADGNIQGEERDDVFAQDTLGRISAHRHRLGKTGVFGFEDIDFAGGSGRGTPQVATRVAQLLSASRERTHNNELAVVGLGTGEARDLPTSHCYDRTVDRGFAGQFEIVLALDSRGEPVTLLEAELPPSYDPRCRF